MESRKDVKTHSLSRGEELQYLRTPTGPPEKNHDCIFQLNLMYHRHSCIALNSPGFNGNPDLVRTLKTTKQENNKHHTSSWLIALEWFDLLFTCKRSNSPLDVVPVVALNAVQMLAKDEWRSGDEDDSGDGKNSKDTVPDCTSLLQEDPGQQGGKDWITMGGVRVGQ